MKNELLCKKLQLDFPTYNDQNNNFKQSLLGILKDKKILTPTSNVLDISSSTGAYIIPIAKEVKNVLNLDTSEKRQEALKEDAWFNNVNGIIETKVIDWKKFKSDENYDVVFAPLSTTYKDIKELERFIWHPKSFVCFLRLTNTQGSNFEKLLSEKYDIKKEEYSNLKNIKDLLKSKNIKYNIVQLKNHYTELLDNEMAIQKIQEFISDSNTKLKLIDNKIETIIKPLTINGQVEHQSELKLELIYWKNE